MATILPEFTQLFSLIQQAQRILLVADGKPDGDSLGSSSGMLNWLLREGKDASAFCAAPIPNVFSYLDNIHRYTNDPVIFQQKFDLIITFDAGDLRHCGIDQILPKAPKGYTLVDIDHHSTNARYGDLNLVFTDACSTAEVVFRFLQTMHVPLDPKIATSLLTGIFTDTMTFSNAATTTEGMEAAGILCAAGARKTEILHKLFKNRSIDGLKLWGLALSRLKHQPHLNLVSTYFLKEDLTQPGLEDAVEGISNFLNATCGNADTILVIRELPGGVIKGSLRSAKRDISRVAKLFGGGGHKKAAGFTLSGRLQETAQGVRVIPS
ncbi:DHH family phosphoesterase [Patescibacteria group bacterium]|nr:DHH family phosphoesterase [Patescibacteria group bacterium]